MADGMPPLVDRPDSWQYIPRPDGLPGTWPALPPTPATGWQGSNVAAPVEQPPVWAMANPGWAVPAPGFAYPAVMAQPMPPQPAAPVVTPFAGHTPFHAAADDWVHHIPRPATPAAGPHTPFDSPRSDVSHISRSHSFSGAIREDLKRPPREWRTGFSMRKISGVESAFGSLLRSRSLSRNGECSLPHRFDIA